MKKSVIAALALSLVLVAGAASASIIGIFGDAGATSCAKNFTTPYVTETVHMVALLDDIVFMSACEFGATGVNLPAGASAPPTVTYSTTLVIGGVLSPDGVALAWQTPLEAPLAYLGSIGYFMITPAVLGNDYVMQVVPSGAGNLVVVDAETATEVPAEGWRMIINCVVGGPNGNCGCEDTIATEDAAWGQIKALY